MRVARRVENVLYIYRDVIVPHDIYDLILHSVGEETHHMMYDSTGFNINFRWLDVMREVVFIGTSQCDITMKEPVMRSLCL